MKQHGVTQAELASHCATTPQSVRGWLRRGVINARHVAKVARLLEVNIEFLLVGTAPGQPVAKAPPGYVRLSPEWQRLLRHLTPDRQRLLMAFANESKERIQDLEDSLEYIKKLCPVVTELQHKRLPRKRASKRDDC
jgi:transcriptional regulator with XRE-family HTH domain